MYAVIISAWKTTIASHFNNHRHNMLVDSLRAEGYSVSLGKGSDGSTGKEDLAIIYMQYPLQDGEVEFFDTLCSVFGQDYWLYVNNDKAYKCTSGAPDVELGTWWTMGESTPREVWDAVDQGIFTADRANGALYGIQTFEMMAEAEGKAFDAACGIQFETVDHPRCRAFIYGTPEYFEKMMSARRNQQY